MTIAYIASRVTLPGSPIRRSDAFEHDFMVDALRPALAAKGMALQEIAWDDERADWGSFDAAIIGTTWDYWDRPEAFLAKLREIETKTRLFNSSDTVAWNMDKQYLKALAAKGAQLIPTLWIDVVTQASAKAAFAELGSDDLVFKRQVGAGAEGQHRLASGDVVPDMPHAMMVQPFLKAIQTEGELSFIYIDGAFSHALLKKAKDGDYRIQTTYGGHEEQASPGASDLAASKAVLDSLNETPLYARVDMLRDTDGGLLLMELELIEPYLYPKQGPELGSRIGAALVKHLA